MKRLVLFTIVVSLGFSSVSFAASDALDPLQVCTHEVMGVEMLVSSDDAPKNAQEVSARAQSMKTEVQKRCSRAVSELKRMSADERKSQIDIAVKAAMKKIGLINKDSDPVAPGLQPLVNRVQVDITSFADQVPLPTATQVATIAAAKKAIVLVPRDITDAQAHQLCFKTHGIALVADISKMMKAAYKEPGFSGFKPRKLDENLKDIIYDEGNFGSDSPCSLALQNVAHQKQLFRGEIPPDPVPDTPVEPCHVAQ